MTNTQKIGGLAALVLAATYTLGMALWITLLIPAGYGNLDLDPIEHVIFLADNLTLMYAFYLIVYLLNALALIVLVLALADRLKRGPQLLVHAATALGIIWAALIIASAMVANVGASIALSYYDHNPAHSGTAWVSMHLVLISLGGGNEIIGGLWVLLLSCMALHQRELPKALNYLGIVVGVSGILTTIPPLSALGALFGLGFIGWFLWSGVILLRSNQLASTNDRQSYTLL